MSAEEVRDRLSISQLQDDVVLPARAAVEQQGAAPVKVHLHLHLHLHLQEYEAVLLAPAAAEQQVVAPVKVHLHLHLHLYLKPHLQSCKKSLTIPGTQIWGPKIFRKVYQVSIWKIRQHA